MIQRAWLIAALALFMGASCATGNVIAEDSVRASDVRVDVKWRLDLASDRMWQMDPVELGEPILSPGGDLLVGASNGWVYRIEPNSGDVTWAHEVGGSVDSAGTLMGRKVYIGTDGGYLVKIDWTTGEEEWRFETRGSVESRPSVSEGRVFITDSEEILYALDAVTGDLLWDYQPEAPEFFTIKGGGNPLVSGSTVYCGFADGTLAALHVDGGELIWSVSLGDETGEFGDIDIPLFEDGERLIATSHAGGIYAIERDSGVVGWHADVADVAGAELAKNWYFGASSSGKVFALDTREGEIYWEYELPDGHAPVDISMVGPFVAVAVANGPMYWLHLRNGEPAAKWAPSSGFQNAPIFDDRYGFAISNRGYLYGFALAF